VFGSGQSDWDLIANKTGMTRLGLRCREPGKHGTDRAPLTAMQAELPAPP
jgi:hypothetical protein